MCTLKKLQSDSDRDVRHIMGSDSTWLPPDQSPDISGVSALQSSIDLDDMALFFDPACIEEAIGFT